MRRSVPSTPRIPGSPVRREGDSLAPRLAVDPQRRIGVDPSMRKVDLSERIALNAFHALPGPFAVRDSQDLMAYPFFSLAKSKRVAPIHFRTGTLTIEVEATSQFGMATIWDADVLIWAASQLVEARDRGLPTSRLMVMTPYEILTFGRRGPPCALITGSRPPWIGCSPRPLQPQSVSQRNAGCTGSRGSTNGRNAPTPTVGPSGSSWSSRIGSIADCWTMVYS